MAVRIATAMRDAAYTASIALAAEKGAFPLFNADQYLEAGTFASRLPSPLRADIREHGIRNSHLLSIAPTGTVSLAFADNASNGIEPAFAWMYLRKKREADGSTTEYEVQDHAWRVYREQGGDLNALPPAFVSALSMTADDHIAMMAAVQPLVDTAISKTVNVPADCPFADFQNLYQQAWTAGLKGLATYRPNAILGAVLQALPSAPAADAAPGVTLGAETGAEGENNKQIANNPHPASAVVEKRPKGGLPAVVEKVEYWTHEGHKTLYLVVSFLPMATAPGQPPLERAIEFFMPVGQNGESQQWVTASMRLLSLAARGGFLDRALNDMRKVAWDRGPVRLGTHTKADGMVVPLWHDSEVAAIGCAIQQIIARRESELARTATAQSLQATEPPHEPADEQANGPTPPTGYALPPMVGKKCPECGAHAMIRKDGCDACTQCGHLGACG